MLLELKNVSVAYRDGFGFRSKNKIAIDNISFTVEEGENVGIVGSNGAGKSTLLKLLAGIYKPSEGEIVLHKPCRASFIGLASGFVPYLNGAQNIRLVGMLYGLSRKEIEQRLEEIIAYSELGDAIERPVYTYSAGMRARLAFSVSVFSQPDLILLDEVMGVGDASFRKKSSETLKGMINGNASAIIVSHEDTYLKSVCNKIIRLEAGKLVDKESDAEGVSEINPERTDGNVTIEGVPLISKNKRDVQNA